ncbi:MAG: hypothetical protein R2860_05565 [Desulfobacterales bacterium]
MEVNDSMGHAVRNSCGDPREVETDSDEVVEIQKKLSATEKTRPLLGGSRQPG